APAPSGGGATAVAANRDFPSSVPRSAENHLSALISESVAHPGDPSSVCVLACYGSRPRPRSTTQSSAPPAAVQTSAPVHWLPSPPAPLFPRPRDHGRTSPLPRGAAVAALAVLHCRYPLTQFVGRPGGNRIL